MKEFYVKSAVVTFCLVILSQFFQFTVHSQTTNHFENPKYSSSSDNQLVYELINETTRFNKKTGDLEYFISDSEEDIKQHLRWGCSTGSWKNKDHLGKIQSL
jgi:hypothetical protein